MSETEIIIVACCIGTIGCYFVLAWANIRLQKACRALIGANTELMDSLHAHTNLNRVMCQQRDDALELVRYWEAQARDQEGPTIN